MTEELDVDAPPVLLKPMSPEKAAVETLQSLMRIEWRLTRIEAILKETEEIKREALAVITEYLREHP